MPKIMGKSQIFDCFYLLFLLCGKAFFVPRIFSNTFSWPISRMRKSQNRGFSTFSTCYFYSVERLFFLCRISLNTFFLAYFAYNIKIKTLPVCDQNYGLFWKNPKFSTFLTCFYSLERLFFFLEYIQTHFD